MVNKKKVERKIPSMLVDVPISTPEALNEYNRKDRRLRNLKRNKPAFYQNSLNKVCAVLDALDRQAEIEIETLLNKRKR